MASKKAVKLQLKQSNIDNKVKNFVLTAITMMTVCSNISAQTTKKPEKDKEGIKTEAKVAYSNLSALKVQKDGTAFYNDFVPTATLSAESGDWFANASAGELVIFSESNWTTINNRLLLEIGRHFGEDTELYIKAGRTPMQAGNVFFNQVGTVEYYTDSQGFGTFGDAQQGLFVCLKHKGHELILGSSNQSGDGWYFMPNLTDPEVRAFYGMINESFEANGFKVSLSAASRLGKNTHQVFSSVSATNGKLGVAAGGNYDFDTNVSNAYIRGSYKSLNSGVTYVVQALKTNQIYTIHLAAGKKGLQGFVEVDNITSTQRDPAKFTSTPTVNVGVSYTFGDGRKL